MSKSGYVSLDEVVKGYLSISEQSMSKYLKCWNLAWNGLTELGLDFFARVKTVKLPINANKTVTLPDDYKKYTKVGLLNARGEVVPMRYNPNLTSFADLEADRKAKTTDNDLYGAYLWGAPIFYNYWYGSYYGNYYGIPSGGYYIGSFKIDEENGVILLGDWFHYDYIMLEYIANPAEGSDCQIPEIFKMALTWYISWMDVAMVSSAKRGAGGTAAFRERNFYNERRKAGARWKPLHLDEAYKWAIQNQRLVVKAG